MEQHQSLMKKKNRVHTKNLQFEEEKRIYYQDKITYFEMSKAIKTELDKCLQSMKQNVHQGIANNPEHTCHKLQQQIVKIETLMKEFTCDPYLTEHKAIIKALDSDINDTEAQIAILSVMGLSIQQMASTLNKSEHSIITYRQALKTKLGLKSAHDLVPHLNGYFGLS
jgi:DNA-binding CsgD family transcriptional regulator